MFASMPALSVDQDATAQSSSSYEILPSFQALEVGGFHCVGAGSGWSGKHSGGHRHVYKVYSGIPNA